MKYRLTPANGLALFISGSAFCYINGSMFDAHDRLGGYYLLMFSIIVLMCDLFLQFFITNNRKLFIIELIGLPLIILVVLAA